MNVRSSTRFVGAKIAILCQGDLVTYLRDDFDHIPDPNLWDFPGGECVTGETALACALRETQEEFAISLSESQIVYEGHYASHQPGRADVAFFVAVVHAELIAQIRFGDEGQFWKMMQIRAFLDHGQAVSELQKALVAYTQAG